MRNLMALTLLVACSSTGAADPVATLTLRWQDRFLEVIGPQIPGGPIRTHYLEAYCRPGSTDRDWNETVIPHQSRLVLGLRRREAN